MRIRLIPALVMGIMVVSGTVAVVRGRPVNSRPDAAAYVAVPNTSTVSLDRAYADGAVLEKDPSGPVSAGIVPHHLLAAPLIAAFVSGVRNGSVPHTVVIVGPDHDNVGRGYLTTSRTNWSTPDGNVMTDAGLVDALVDEGIVTIDDDLIRKEHSVYTPLPFIRRSLPGAQVVLIAVRGDLRPDKLDMLVSALAMRLGPDDLVVASVDFSHYKNAAGAWEDDAVTLPIIAAKNETASLTIPVDSPPAISLVLRYANRRALAYQQLVHTNSAELMHDLTLTSTTSYLTANFYR